MAPFLKISAIFKDELLVMKAENFEVKTNLYKPIYAIFAFSIISVVNNGFQAF